MSDIDWPSSSGLSGSNLEIEGPSIQLAGPEASTKANYDGPTEYIPIADAGSVQAQETETT